MPSTSQGYPYPDGTAKVGEFPVKVQDLAAAINRKVQGGAVTFASATGIVDIAVVFPVPCTNTPAVATGHNADGSGVVVTNIAARFLTNTGFSYRIQRTASNAAISGRWIAVDFTS